MFIHSNRARAVKGFDSKSNGLSPRRFESCRLRFAVPNNFQSLSVCSFGVLSLAFCHDFCATTTAGRRWMVDIYGREVNSSSATAQQRA